MTTAIANTVVAFIGPFEIVKVTREHNSRTVGAGYDLYRHDPDVGRSFIGHYRDVRDCERVVKREIKNAEDADFAETFQKVTDVMADNGSLHFSDAQG